MGQPRMTNLYFGHACGFAPEMAPAPLGLVPSTDYLSLVSVFSPSTGRRTTTRFRSTARTRSLHERRWWSCIATSRSTARRLAPGSIYTPEGTYPTNHAEHETVEITQGLTKWSEVGFYIFTSIGPNGQGWQWVGDHIRPRVRAPDSWHWPVGVSISNEIGYQRARFSPDTWTWEIRPIMDKQMGRWYLSFNPTFDRSFHGPSVNQGFTFSPNVKVGYDITKKVNAGIEYYGDYGDVGILASPARSATADSCGDGSECFAEVGVQLWHRCGDDGVDGSPDCKGDCGPQVWLAKPTGVTGD